MITTIQEVYFDLVDLVENNPDLMNLKIQGFEEFATLGDFVDEQRAKMTYLEECVEE